MFRKSLADDTHPRLAGFRAGEGGQHDWVTRGALASRDIENALFVLPVGKLSRIISDESGVHIVKVLERVEDGVTAFTDAQGEIKQKIVKRRRKDEIDAYLQTDKGQHKLKEEIGDVFIFCLYLAESLGVDLSEAVDYKMKLNETKYPVEKSYNSNKKYDELDDPS